VNKNIIFDEIPPGALPMYDPSPDMFLNEKMKPQVYSKNTIPPRLEISERVGCHINDFSKERSNVFSKLKKKLSKIGEAFLDGGMKKVVIGVYPVVGMGLMKHGKWKKSTMAVFDYCMVAYKDDIDVI
jgi:hypothetical protein